MLGRTDSRRRLLFLLGLFLVGVVALVARTAYWQVVRADWLMVRAVAQTTVTSRDARPARGDLRPDGRRPPGHDRRPRPARRVGRPDRRRARSTRPPGPSSACSAWTPRARRPCRERLASRQAVRRSSPAASTRSWPTGSARRRATAGIDRHQPRVRAGAGLPAGRRRTGLDAWPPTSSASSTARAPGQYGVEQFYQDELAGRPRVIVAAARRQRPDPLAETTDTTQPGVAGEDLRLTIDAGLQLAVEQELLAAWVADQAKSVSAVVMDPYTGEIYAQATYPSYDANDYGPLAAADPSRFIDPIVSHVYEPGSVFKMMTAAAALESGTVTPKTKIKDVGTLKLDNGKSKIDNADRKGMGWITFEDGIAYSRNVVAAKVALRLGDTTARCLGRASTTCGAGSGSAARPASTSPARSAASSATRPSSRGARSTSPTARSARAWRSRPLQLATAYAAMVNGGRLVRPHVVKSVGGDRAAGRPRRPRSSTPTSATTAGTGRPRRRRGAVLPRRTRVPGYHVGGKTGTAQIWDAEQGRWKHNLFNYSFVGYIGRRSGHARPHRRRPHRGGHADGRTRRPAGDAGHVVRAVPAHRHRRHHHARTCSRTARDPERSTAASRPVTAWPCHTGRP